MCGKRSTTNFGQCAGAWFHRSFDGSGHDQCSAESLLERPSFKQLVGTGAAWFRLMGSTVAQRKQPQGADVHLSQEPHAVRFPRAVGLLGRPRHGQRALHLHNHYHARDSVGASTTECPSSMTRHRGTRRLPGQADLRYCLSSTTRRSWTKRQGFVWEQSPKSLARTWSQAHSSCNDLSLGNRKGWRLITAQEDTFEPSPVARLGTGVWPDTARGSAA